MYARRTVALLVLASLLVAGTGAATVTGASSAAQAENTTVDHGGEAVTLVTDPNATVTGETSLDPGSNLTVRLRSTGESPFLLTDETAVREDGRFTATFDLSEMPDGANATLTVRADGERLAEIPARLVAEPTPTASPAPATESPTPANTSPGGGPGFGALAAVVAAVGTALIVTRRA
jgi:PGF-CTERM protein